MSKALLYASTVRPNGQLHEEMLEGIAQIALAVGSTLGPRGRNVIIDRAGEAPITTKDGVTVARNIYLTNPVHNAAVKMIQGVAKATVDEAGDGTTTATVLAHAIFREGLKLVSSDPGAVSRSIFGRRRRTAPIGAIQLQRAITVAVGHCVEGIRRAAKEPTDEQILQVALVSTNGNHVLSHLIQDGVLEIGRKGLITLDGSDRPESWLELRAGFHFSSGFTSPDFITDSARGVAVLDNPLIFLTERLLTQGISGNPTLHDLGPLCNFAAGLGTVNGKQAQVREPRSLLIVCDGIAGDAAQLISLNHINKNIQVCVVVAPDYGEFRRGALADMAMATGGEVLTVDSGDVVSKWVLDHHGRYDGSRLGTCTRAVVTNSTTVLEGCPGEPQLLAGFADNLNSQATASPNPVAREFLLHRAARLTGKVAVLHVGAPTDEEARALRDAAEDAVHAVRGALAEGIVPGGGLCLFGMADLLSSVPDLGAQLVAECMREPLRLIASNSGEDPVRVCAEVTRRARQLGGWVHGFNAATGEYQDLFAAGIVDPAKVVRVALEKAASIAGLLLTSSCLVYLDPDAYHGMQRADPGTHTAGFRA